MEMILIVLVVLLVAGNAFIVFWLLKPKEQKSENTEGMILLQKQLQDLTRQDGAHIEQDVRLAAAASSNRQT